MILNEEDIRRKESALVTILEMMDMPQPRIERKDWQWCLRNIKVRNSDHPMCLTAEELLRCVIKYK